MSPPPRLLNRMRVPLAPPSGHRTTPPPPPRMHCYRVDDRTDKRRRFIIRRRFGTKQLVPFLCMSVCRRRKCILTEMRLRLDGVVAAATDTVGVLPGEMEVGVPTIGYKPNDNGRHLFRPIIVRPCIITCMRFTLSYIVR